jgi:hypothetical protein
LQAVVVEARARKARMRRRVEKRIVNLVEWRVRRVRVG